MLKEEKRMKNGKVVIVFAVALFLVVATGIALAGIIPIRPAADCYGGCYYCNPTTGCTMYDGPGGCFCTRNPCNLGHWFCAKAN